MARDSDYYAPGSYNDPSAPWNEPVIPERDFDLGVVVKLSRDVTICTDNYRPEYDEEDGRTYANTDDTDWCDEYNEKCLTIPDLLNSLECYVQDDLKRYKGNVRKERELNEILEACQGWSVDEIEVGEL